MVKLDYTEASVLGGMPRTQDTITLDEYMYACGLFPPRHPVPALVEINWVDVGRAKAYFEIHLQVRKD